jgi:endonuclease-3
MKDCDITNVIKRIRKQVKTLDIPWLDAMSRIDRDPFKVLISCVLSLRTQDKTTGEASRRLFKRASTPKALSLINTKEIQKTIYPVGFYNVKAKTLKSLSKTLIDTYKGIVPDTIDELLTLKGVGRKTANLVVTLGWNKPGICVDTHVHRITNRFGYVKTKTPDETEFALRKKLPRRYWKEVNGLLVAYGQGICKPVSPLCSKCSVVDYCSKINVTRSR